MADEEEVVEPTEPIEPEEPTEEPPEESAEEPPEENHDDAARKQGWVPKEEFYGNPDDWRDSKQFIARGKEILSHVRTGYDKRISDMETDFAQRMTRMERMSDANMTRQAETIRAEFSAKKLAAVRDMDEEAHSAAEEGERAALGQMQQSAVEANRAPPAGPRISPADKAVVDEWTADNQWFFSDRVLTAAGDEHFTAVNAEMPAASMTDRLAEVKRRCAADFPKKFGIRKDTQPRVEGGGRQAGGGTSKPKFASLPKEAKDSFAMMKSMDVYTDKDKEEYAAAYYED